jgi:hypothetical protein
VRNAVVQAYQRSSMLERRRLQRIAEASDHRSGVGMKIIFSRKGVDSAAGRCASPLLAGRPLSLPIPTRMPTATKYRDLSPLTAEIRVTCPGAPYRLIGPVTSTPTLTERLLLAIGQMDGEEHSVNVHRRSPTSAMLGSGLMTFSFSGASIESASALQLAGATRDRDSI